MPKAAFEVVMLGLEQIELSPDNPRLDFTKKDLQELSESLKTDGMIEPIVVRKSGLKYEVVVGERRARAAAYSGLTQIPAIVRNVSDEEASRLRLIENIIRRDLDVFERVAGIRAYMSKYGMNLQQVAAVLHKSPETLQGWFKVAYSTSPRIRSSDKFRRLGLEQLRELAKYDDETQEKLAEAIVDHGLIVHQARRFLAAFDRRPDLKRLDELARKIKEEYKTVTITVPASRVRQIKQQLEEEARRQERERLKAKRRLQKHLRPKPPSAKASILPATRSPVQLETIQIPYEAKSLLERMIQNPARQMELARIIESENFDEWEIRFLLDLARQEPQLAASELVRRVVEESDKRGKVSFMVVEMRPRFRGLVVQESNKRRSDPKTTLVDLATERMIQLGYQV